MAHRPPRGVDRSLVLARRVEPGAVRAGDPSAEIGDRGDQCRPGLGRGFGIRPIVAAGVEAQGSGAVQSRNAAVAQIRFRDCARKRLGHGEQPSCGFRRSGWRWRHPPGMVRLGPWQAEERSGFVEDVRQAGEAPVHGDQVEKIAMLAGGGVGPFAGGALAAVRPFQPDEQAAAGRVGDIADQPVAAFLATVGEIMTAHRLGIAREPVRQFRGLRRHCAGLMPPPCRQCAGADSAPSAGPGWPALPRRSARTGAASTR